MEREFWGILELMGHVKLAGRISEEEMYGSKIGRIDIPTKEGQSCINGHWMPVGFILQNHRTMIVSDLTSCRSTRIN